MSSDGMIYAIVICMIMLIIFVYGFLLLGVGSDRPKREWVYPCCDHCEANGFWHEGPMDRHTQPCREDKFGDPTKFCQSTADAVSANGN